MVTKDNWNYLHYQNAHSKMFISLGGKLEQDENYTELYFVTVSDLEYKEKFQEEFLNLQDAIFYINDKYAHFDELDTRISGSGSGCDTCEAH